MKLMSFISMAFVTLMALFFAGCGNSQPSASDGENVVRSAVEANSNGKIKLISFHKTNGQSGMVDGVETYKMDCEAEIEFTEDCDWWTGDNYFYSHKRLQFKTKPMPNEAYGRESMKKGQHAKIAGTIQLEKTENGWRGWFDGQAAEKVSG